MTCQWKWRSWLGTAIKKNCEVKLLNEIPTILSDNCGVKLLNEIPTLLSDNWISNNNTTNMSLEFDVFASLIFF